jgi:hypothetical protein
METQIITIKDSLLSSFTTFMNFIPTLIGALVVLVIGWLLSSIVARVIERILVAVKLDHAVAHAGVHRYVGTEPGHVSASHLLAVVAKWFIRLIFLQAAANLLGMPQVTNIINSILLFLPNLAVAIVILIVGAYLAKYVAAVVFETVTRSELARPQVFSALSRYAILGFAAIAALSQIGVAVTLVNTLLVGLVGSLSLAVGLAFGLGGQGVASDLTRSWYEQARSRGDHIKPVRPREDVKDKGTGAA